MLSPLLSDYVLYLTPPTTLYFHDKEFKLCSVLSNFLLTLNGYTTMKLKYGIQLINVQ